MLNVVLRTIVLPTRYLVSLAGNENPSIKFSSYLNFTKKKNKSKMNFYKKFKIKFDFFAYDLLSKARLPVAQLASINYPMTWPEKKHLLLELV